MTNPQDPYQNQNNQNDDPYELEDLPPQQPVHQQPPQQPQYQYNPPGQFSPPMQEQSEGGGTAVAALVLGIVGVVVWLCPFIGLIVGIIGLILGFMGMKTPKRTMALVGIVLSGIAIFLSIINAIVGVIINMS